MFCERCHGRTASVHIVKIINGQKTELHLCSECANKENAMGIIPAEMNTSIHSLFEPPLFNLFPQYRGSLRVKRANRRNGNRKIVGNKQSYDEFRNKLRPIFTKNPDASYRMPAEEEKEKNTAPTGILAQWENELQACIRKEDFEQAAVLRDKIQDYKKKHTDQ